MAKQYTGKERVEAVFQREKADRIPVIPGLTLHLAPQAGYGLNEARLDPEKAWKTFLLSEEMLPSDLVGVPANPYLPDAIRSRQESVMAPEARGQRRLADKASLDTFSYRPPKESRAYVTFLDTARRTVATLPDRAVNALVGAPWSIAAELRGIEQLIYDTADDPEFVHRLMQVCTQMCLDRALAMAETGVYLKIADPTAGCSLISPKIYREFAKPYQEQVFNRLRQETNVRIGLHMCGYVDPIMEDLISLPIDWFELDSLSSLERMASLSQGKIVIRGNMSATVFVEGTKDEIYAEVKRCVDAAGQTNPLMLAPGCSIPYTAPAEKIKDFLEASYKYGSYDYING